MQRRWTLLLLCAVLFSAVTALRNSLPVSASDPQQAQPDPAMLLQRADIAMQSVHTLHTVGHHTSNDPSARLDVRITGNCASAEGMGLPLKVRAQVRGTYAAAGKPLRQVNTLYLLSGRFSPPGGQAWQLSPSTRGAWVHGPFDDVLNASYARQICPALVRATYIHGYLTGAGRSPQRANLGLTTVNGHATWHVRQVLGFTLDYFIDAQTYQLRRLVLSGNLGTTWQETFDYSRFNSPVAIRMPR